MAARKSCRHHRTLLVQNCREMRIVDVAQCLLDDTPPITPRDDVAPAVRAMPAHQGERLVDAIELARRGQTQPQLIVVTHDQLLIERSYLLEEVPCRDHAWHCNDRIRQQPLSHPARRYGAARTAWRERLTGRVN